MLSALAAILLTASVYATPAEDEALVAALDTEYQAAVERNDADTMDRILADDFTLVTGRGQTYDKAALLDSARQADATYELQREEPGTQKVRVHGDTAVVTALLTLKGTREGKGFDYQLWFSDTYVRTPEGWKYFFGQASLPLPKP
jgi:ketosteroid isomerase-like protein